MAAEFTARTFEKTDHRSPLRFIWSHIRRHPAAGLLMIVGAFSNAALASAVPYFLGQAFNTIIQTGDLQRVAWLAVMLTASQLMRGGLQLMRNYSAETFAQRIERDVRDELYASLLGKSMAYHDSQPVGEIMARVVNDVRELNLFMSPGLNLLIGSSFFLIMPLVTAPTIHPALIATPLIFISLYALVQYRYTLRAHQIGQQVRTSFGHMNARLAEALDGIQVVKGAAQEDQEIAVFDDLADTVRDRFVEQGEEQARYLALLLFGLAVFVGYLHSIYLYRIGQIDTGDIVNFMGQLSLFTFPVFSSLFALLRLAQGYASAERIINVITAPTDLDQNRAGVSRRIEGAIRFEGVSFGYADGKQVLEDVSFEVHPGQTVALVGQTGAGKSTITKLINRTYDVTAGRVLIDGVDVRDWALESLRSQISVIEQEIFLFSRSIADNIRFGCDEAPMKAVIEAAKKAQAHEFITALPDGYETVIGQRGVTLSGGQRQRLALARAFLTDPQILILDDSTSAIDSATEDHIQKAIWTAAKGRTTVLITHRLSQIRWADHIVVLRNGRVAAQGKHEDLLRSSEVYRRIFARYELPREGQQDSQPAGESGAQG
ncbi:MAG: ABC transporter ATP-binding protein [Anaerolineae bacterium]